MAQSPLNTDTVPHVIPFILSRLEAHTKAHAPTPSPPPFFVGLNGVQGVGKSVLVSQPKKTLESEPYNLRTAVISLDNFYLTHEEQQRLAKANPTNPLLQHRGQPGTHELPLARNTFRALRERDAVKLPVYNKAAFSGQGDRCPEAEWIPVNQEPSSIVRVVLFEGWSVGFRAFAPQRLGEKYEHAVSALRSAPDEYEGRLAHNTLRSLTTVNEALRR
ncbi:D-glycerate 3-kinase [Paraphaeosphaeria sporulosa]